MLADQSGALPAGETRSGEIHQLDVTVGTEGEIAGRREIIEFRVFLQHTLHAITGCQQFCILQFEFDLINLEFVNQPLTV